VTGEEPRANKKEIRTMTRIPKSVLTLGGVILAVGVLPLAVPRAAHAVAAILVTVVNTAENPAITQSASEQAAQLIFLTNSIVPNSALKLSSFSGGPAYSVPAGFSLVITAVDLTPGFECASGIFTFALNGNTNNTNAFKAWAVSPPNTGHFEYPSRIVFGPGSSLLVGFSASNTSGGCANPATVDALWLSDVQLVPQV
jgi:hypothetical protein